MLAEERQLIIVAQVNSVGSVRVKELSKQFGVTEDCIRKDLTLLEKKGLLKKAYGGAVKLRVNVHDFHASQRKDKNIEGKQVIAKKAITLIREGDVIFLDNSTANVELAKLIVERDMKITIVTNMISIMNICLSAHLTKMIFLGGIVSDGKDCFEGAMTNEQIKKFRFDLAFMGVVGVDLNDNRVEVYYPEDGITKTTALHAASKAYMMLETQKFSTTGPYKYAKVSEFAGAIMDAEPCETFRSEMDKYRLEWL